MSDGLLRVDDTIVAELATFSTPSILNGLKRLGVDSAALQSFDRQVVHCISPQLGIRVGFAVTRTIATRRSGPPADAALTAELTRRGDADMSTLPEPRFLVVQNVGDWPGPVCIWGEVMAYINVASGVRAGITNGPVRDVPEMEAAGFAAFAGGVAVGGGHVDLVAVSQPVAVGGVVVEMGDLIHADLHGAVKVPAELAAELPDAIRRHSRHERRVIDVCKSPSFSAAALAEALQVKE
jgi:regulator of RNase E activity RraA